MQFKSILILASFALSAAQEATEAPVDPCMAEENGAFDGSGTKDTIVPQRASSLTIALSCLQIYLRIFVN